MRPGSMSISSHAVPTLQIDISCSEHIAAGESSHAESAEALAAGKSCQECYFHGAQFCIVIHALSPLMRPAGNVEPGQELRRCVCPRLDPRHRMKRICSMDGYGTRTRLRHLMRVGLSGFLKLCVACCTAQNGGLARDNNSRDCQTTRRRVQVLHNRAVTQ